MRGRSARNPRIRRRTSSAPRPRSRACRRGQWRWCIRPASRAPRGCRRSCRPRPPCSRSPAAIGGPAGRERHHDGDGTRGICLGRREGGHCRQQCGAEDLPEWGSFHDAGVYRVCAIEVSLRRVPHRRALLPRAVVHGRADGGLRRLRIQSMERDRAARRVLRPAARHADASDSGQARIRHQDHRSRRKAPHRDAFNGAFRCKHSVVGFPGPRIRGRRMDTPSANGARHCRQDSRVGSERRKSRGGPEAFVGGQDRRLPRRRLFGRGRVRERGDLPCDPETRRMHARQRR